MEKLHLRSDGYAETPSGLFATVMTRSSGVTATGLNWFRFKTTSYQDRVTLEWPTSTDVIIVSKDIVDFLEAHRYARPLTADEVDGYNEAVDAAPAAPEAPEATPVAPEATPVAPTAETPPTGQETGAPGGSNEPPPPPPDEPPAVPPVATEGESDAAGSKTPEQLAAEQILASMTKPKKG